MQLKHFQEKLEWKEEYVIDKFKSKLRENGYNGQISRWRRGSEEETENLLTRRIRRKYLTYAK